MIKAIKLDHVCMYVCIIIIIIHISFSNIMLMSFLGLRKESWTMNEDYVSIHKWVIFIHGCFNFKGIIYG